MGVGFSSPTVFLEKSFLIASPGPPSESSESSAFLKAAMAAGMARATATTPTVIGIQCFLIKPSGEEDDGPDDPVPLVVAGVVEEGAFVPDVSVAGSTAGSTVVGFVGSESDVGAVDVVVEDISGCEGKFTKEWRWKSEGELG